MSGQVTDVTDEMVEAGASVLCRKELAFATKEYWAKEVYRAMLSAAPASPQPQGADNQYECECFKCGKHFIGNRVHICPDCRAVHPQPSGDGLSDETLREMLAVECDKSGHNYASSVMRHPEKYGESHWCNVALKFARAVEARVRSQPVQQGAGHVFAIAVPTGRTETR